jgi:hypothetical protein
MAKVAPEVRPNEPTLPINEGAALASENVKVSEKTGSGDNGAREEVAEAFC